MSLNKVMLIGNLGRDPEVKHLDNNKMVATFTLATNENYTDRNGERRTETEWHAIEVWDNLARTAERFCKQGTQVYIEGKIKTENWKDKDGNDKSRKKIRGTSLVLLGNTNKNNDAAAPTQNQSASNSGGNYPQSEQTDDDLPF